MEGDLPLQLSIIELKEVEVQNHCGDNNGVFEMLTPTGQQKDMSLFWLQWQSA